MAVARRLALLVVITLPLQAATRGEITRVFQTLYAVYDTAGIVERVRLEGKTRRISGPAELSKAMFGSDALVEMLVDPWGTPLHIEVSPSTGYLIVAAGSDRKFDRASWKTPARTTSTAADVVLRNGTLVRSPEEWAMSQAKLTPEQLNGELSRSKHVATVSTLRSIASAMETFLAIEGKYPPVRDIDELPGRLSPRYMKDVPRTDAWGRKLDLAVVSTLDGYLLISAGADGKFETTDDIVLENGRVVKNADPPATDRMVEAWAGYMAARARLQQAK
jgi:hypothetical protein